tara:strand:- start:999 stop:1613 length:615 start_codon:yes stop_codon:yes gene_type:complete
MVAPIHNDAGFSLVETLIATVVFAIVSASGVMILSGYQDGRQGLAAADERLAQLDTARSLMRSDLLMVVSRPVRDALGGGVTGFTGGALLGNGSLLQFVRNGDMGALVQGNRSALKRVEYRLEEGALLRRTYAQTDITPETESRDAVLLSGVEKLEIRFEADGLWVEEWGSTRSISEPPKITEFKIQFVNGRNLNLMFQVGGGV